MLSTQAASKGQPVLINEHAQDKGKISQRDIQLGLAMTGHAATCQWMLVLYRYGHA